MARNFIGSQDLENKIYSLQDKLATVNNQLEDMNEQEHEMLKGLERRLSQESIQLDCPQTTDTDSYDDKRVDPAEDDVVKIEDQLEQTIQDE